MDGYFFAHEGPILLLHEDGLHALLGLVAVADGDHVAQEVEVGLVDWPSEVIARFLQLQLPSPHLPNAHRPVLPTLISTSEHVITNLSESSRYVGFHCTSRTAFWCADSRQSSTRRPCSQRHSLTVPSEEPEAKRGSSSRAVTLVRWEKLLTIHLFFSKLSSLCSQARQLTACPWAATTARSSSCSLRSMMDPSERPTASTASLSMGQKAIARGMQGSLLQRSSDTPDLLQVKRSISREMEAEAKSPKMGRLQAIFRTAALFFSVDFLRSLEQRGSRLCSSVSAEQKRIWPLELQAARMLPWQLYCWSRITPSCRYVQWKRACTAGFYYSIIINHYQTYTPLIGTGTGTVKRVSIIKQIMIGSLGQFIDVDHNNVFETFEGEREEGELSAGKTSKRRGKSTFEQYVPDDKTDLLVRYQRNNIFHINRKKNNSIAREVHSKEAVRRPLYEHHSFFVKPEVGKDYIAKEELKRKHNLLRAILRMKQNEEEPKGESDYEQSFQRLYSGFRAIHPHPVLSNTKEPQLLQGEEMPQQKLVAIPHSKDTRGLSNIKRLEYEQCLSWAKKHNKKGEYFARQLGKVEEKKAGGSAQVSRSLIEEIGKKVHFNLID